MGWIAAAIVYVAFLFKFPKATVITTLILIGLVVLGFGGILAWGAYDEHAKERQRDLVAVEVLVSSKECGFEHPIGVTFMNRSKKVLVAVSGEILQPNVPTNYSSSQEISLPSTVQPNSSTTWCFSPSTDFQGNPKLTLKDGDRPAFKISRYSIRFEE